VFVIISTPCSVLKAILRLCQFKSEQQIITKEKRDIDATNKQKKVEKKLEHVAILYKGDPTIYSIDALYTMIVRLFYYGVMRTTLYCSDMKNDTDIAELLLNFCPKVPNKLTLASTEKNVLSLSLGVRFMSIVIQCKESANLEFIAKMTVLLRKKDIILKDVNSIWGTPPNLIFLANCPYTRFYGFPFLMAESAEMM